MRAVDPGAGRRGAEDRVRRRRVGGVARRRGFGAWMSRGRGGPRDGEG